MTPKYPHGPSKDEFRAAYMTQPGFTPGPWRVDPKRSLRVVAGEDDTVASTGCQESIHHQWAGNTKLIAAAPELLSALKLILAATSRTIDGQEVCQCNDFDFARAAILQATKGE